MLTFFVSPLSALLPAPPAKSTVFSRGSAGLDLLSVAAGKRLGQLPYLLQVAGREREAGFLITKLASSMKEIREEEVSVAEISVSAFSVWFS